MTEHLKEKCCSYNAFKVNESQIVYYPGVAPSNAASMSRSFISFTLRAKPEHLIRVQEDLLLLRLFMLVPLMTE